jgi:hypothetical protein
MPEAKWITQDPAGLRLLQISTHKIYQSFWLFSLTLVTLILTRLLADLYPGLSTPNWIGYECVGLPLDGGMDGGMNGRMETSAA